MRRVFAPWLIGALIPALGCQTPQGAVPKTPETPLKIHSEHGSETPAEKAFVEQERKYASAFFQPFEKDIFKIEDEIRGISLQQSPPPPLSLGRRTFSLRTEQGAHHPHLFELHDGKEVSVLDLDNALIEYPDAVILEMRLAPDADYAAILLKKYPGSPARVFAGKLNGTSRVVELPIDNPSDIEFGKGSSLFLTLADNGRPAALARLDLETIASPTVLFEEPRKEYYLSLKKSESGEYLFVEDGNLERSKLFALRLEDKVPALSELLPESLSAHRTIHDHDGTFYILSFENAPHGRVIWIAPGAQAPAVAIASRENVLISAVRVYKNYMLLLERQGPKSEIEIYDFSTRRLLGVPLPDPLSSVTLTAYDSYEDDAAHLRISSLSTPPSIFKLDLARRTLSHADEIPRFSNHSPYRKELLEARADDGAAIPITLVMKSGDSKQGAKPLLLHAYGAYGDVPSMAFQADLVPLLNRGFVYAIAHVRGGGEFGAAWHAAAVKERKLVSTSDLLSAARELIRLGITSPSNLILHAKSAGAVPAAGAAALHPELFHAAVLEVPFLDIIGQMSDAKLPHTPREYAEWGNPAIPSERAAMERFSPLELLRSAQFPQTLIMAGDKDEIIPLSQPLAWASKFRRLVQDQSQLVVDISPTRGHLGEPQQYLDFENDAKKIAFILHAVKRNDD